MLVDRGSPTNIPCHPKYRLIELCPSLNNRFEISPDTYTHSTEGMKIR